MKPTITTRGAEQARQHLPAILSAAAAGHTTVITRRGHEIAAVVPASAAHRPKAIALTGLAGTGQGLWGKRSSKAISQLRDEWNR